jgi:hypothetical protein
VSVSPQDKRDLLKVAAFLGAVIVIIVLVKMILGY